MRRTLLAVFVFVVAAFSANVKLYLKDGGYQLVREYKVETDRVHFYSIERSQWEDIPLDLVDLKRTESEVSARQAELEKETKIISEEDAAERAIEREASRIPQDPGVYWLDGKETKVIKAGDVAVHTNKGRTILQKLSPIPAVTAKGTLEITGAHSANVFTNPEQEFFFQLAQTERFGIAKLTTKGTVRIVENLTFNPVVKDDVEEDNTMMPVLQRQLSPDGLYKIWPRDPLEPGEYAVVEYTAGKLNMQVYDFAIAPKAGK